MDVQGETWNGLYAPDSASRLAVVAGRAPHGPSQSQSSYELETATAPPEQQCSGICSSTAEVVSHIWCYQNWSDHQHRYVACRITAPEICRFCRSKYALHSNLGG